MENFSFKWYNLRRRKRGTFLGWFWGPSHRHVPWAGIFEVFGRSGLLLGQNERWWLCQRTGNRPFHRSTRPRATGTRQSSFPIQTVKIALLNMTFFLAILAIFFYRIDKINRKLPFCLLIILVKKKSGKLLQNQVCDRIGFEHWFPFSTIHRIFRYLRWNSLGSAEKPLSLQF